MEKQPSVLGELRDSQVLSRKSPFQANVFQWINLSHQWLGLLRRTKDSSFASATRLQQSLWTISPGCHMFTSKSQQKGVLTLAAKRSFEAYSSSHGVKVQQYHDEPQLPLQQEGCRLGETICHPPSGRPPGPPFNQGEQPYLLGLPLSQGERPFPKHSTWSSDAVEDYERQREAEDPLAFADNGWDPDTLHYNAAMKAHDSEDFKVAMIKEANDDTSQLHWAFWEKQNVPAGHKILSAIWAFKQKRRIDTPAVYKHKARINIHGGQQTYGVN
jgi:hypothetical protein